jgi:hypothetical protein
MRLAPLRPGTLGITAFSIAHRMELKRFHHLHLHFHADGTGGWTMSPIDGSVDGSVDRSPNKKTWFGK